MVHDKDRDRFFGRFQFEPKLLLDSGKEGRRVTIAGRSIISGPQKLEIITAIQASLIDNDTPGDLGKLFGDARRAKPLTIEMGAADADAFAVGFARLQLRSAFGEHKIIRRQSTGLRVKLELKTLSEQALDHKALQLVALLRGKTLHLIADVRLGLNIEPARSKPRRPIEDLFLGHRIGPL